ncbi:MAG TPA: hypothetical protein VHY22_02895 [Chthoniobacteraceae bacterium]|jgi:predicted transcriptional regulator|nr:hypothetical protein [Chthoniobacteraceae bacterium]
MPVTASTHRLEPDVQLALDRLSKHLHRPKNRLINEAVKSFVRQKSRELEMTLEASLDALRSHRLRDPDFEQSIEAFVNAEAKSAGSDPAEGKLLRTAKSSARIKIRNLLDA